MTGIVIWNPDFYFAEKSTATKQSLKIPQGQRLFNKHSNVLFLTFFFFVNSDSCSKYDYSDELVW